MLMRPVRFNRAKSGHAKACPQILLACGIGGGVRGSYQPHDRDDDHDIERSQMAGQRERHNGRGECGTEAFPWDGAPRYMIRDRDRIYGAVVTRRLRAMGIRDKPIAAASPWQNGFAERIIGSIRRECLDHVIVLGEIHLRRILKSYADYYNGARTHRSLQKDAPISRPVQRTGVLSSHAILGGLHHSYARI